MGSIWNTLFTRSISVRSLLTSSALSLDLHYCRSTSLLGQFALSLSISIYLRTVEHDGRCELKLTFAVPSLTSSFPFLVSILSISRLVQLQVKTVFGVPGDFNLEFLGE